MRSLASGTTTEIMQDQIDLSVAKPSIKTEFFSDTQSTWKEFDERDMEGRSFSSSNVQERYQVHSFMPPSKKINITLNNFDQQYSTGSGNVKASILRKNLLIRTWSGYDVNTGGSNNTADDFSTRAKFVHTQLLSGKVVPDVSSFTGTIATAAELGVLYGDTTYSATEYAHLGYYTKTFALGTEGENEPRRMVITTDTNKLDFKYRVSPYSDLFGGAWSSFSSMATGSNTKTLAADIDDNFVQYIVRFGQDTWSTATGFNSAVLQFDDDKQLLKQGVVIADEPRYADKVRLVGRDFNRKALEQEVNLPSLTSATPITDVISTVLIRAGIPHATADWINVATTVTLSGTSNEALTNQSAFKIIDKLMDAVNAGNDDIQFQFDDDGNALVKSVPTATEADTLIHYFFNIEDIKKDFDSDRQLQRVTATNKNFIVNAETLLKNVSGTATATLGITYGTSAAYVRYTGNTDTILSEVGRTNSGLTLSLNSGNTYDINVYGNPIKSGQNIRYAERGHAQNILKKEGNTLTKSNPFFSQAMADEYVSYIIGRFGNPAFRIDLSMVANPFFELDDNVLVFDKDTFTTTIFGLRTINETWENPALKQSLTLIDKGIKFDNFIWDRGTSFMLDNTDLTNMLKYDTGLVWDYDLGPTATEDTFDYTRTKEVQFS